MIGTEPLLPGAFGNRLVKVVDLAALENIEEAVTDIRSKVLDGGAETPDEYNSMLADFLGCLGEIVDNTRKALDEGKDWDVYLD